MSTYNFEGKNKGEIILYGLSTCVWCKKTKQLLSDLGVAYQFVEVDNLPTGDREKALAEVKRWNPRCSFPSMVINGAKCVVGFDEEQIKAAVAE
jgi:glutaredoxin-like protein NrdH